MSKGRKKRNRALALKLVHALDGKAKMRRSKLVQTLQAQGYEEQEVDSLLKKMNAPGIVKCTVGKYSDSYIA